ncbi:P-loop containing nucleoside triphosphate hydrolase protein [Wallemia mellicola]|uniref:P-loop containing nucleoside triphosphate hydrolase protein n=1 Tax=Wallemia mellicola TaxID=1708541 RepID=A0A4T0NHK1_9BASI|nr:P-loop containing nucleoside triphosphate hydrolase protein [Wallemia mellicola]
MSMKPLPRNRKNPGLGRALINNQRKEPPKDSQMHTTDYAMSSVTQEKDLDEFLNTAAMAETEFTAEKDKNVTVIQHPSISGHNNPFLLSEEEEQKVKAKHDLKKDQLRLPQRPEWDSRTTPAQLDKSERQSFLNWRRDLAMLVESDDSLLLTPYERNLNVWRQLWRVIERSQLIVQIVDGRNPQMFWARDLDPYTRRMGEKEVNWRTEGKLNVEGKRSLVLINKADLLDIEQRERWADFFDKQGIRYAFFSALNASELIEQLRVVRQVRDEILNADQVAQVAEEQERQRKELEVQDIVESAKENAVENGQHPPIESAEGYVSHARGLPVNVDQAIDAVSKLKTDDNEEKETVAAEATEPAPETAQQPESRRTRVLNIVELEQLFIDEAPDLSYLPAGHKLTIGLVGYPNVGKSSTLNALLGAHRVSVSSTPGKTKHLQTHLLGKSLVLCDCPGLVFPQFASTRAELVCDGVLPIDDMRDWRAPLELVARRIPKSVLEGLYGIKIETRPIEDGGDGIPTAEELATAFAVARGFTRQGSSGGNPDEQRAARIILKDYINAKLLYCHPPSGLNSEEFNAAMRRRMQARARGLGRRLIGSEQGKVQSMKSSSKTSKLDQNFFAQSRPVKLTPNVVGKANEQHGEFSRVQMYPHQGVVADDGTVLKGRKAKQAMAEAGIEVASSKKHFKGGKRTKKRSGQGYD